jgi:hypothetical protein
MRQTNKHTNTIHDLRSAICKLDEEGLLNYKIKHSDQEVDKKIKKRLLSGVPGYLLTVDDLHGQNLDERQG